MSTALVPDANSEHLKDYKWNEETRGGSNRWNEETRGGSNR